MFHDSFSFKILSSVPSSLSILYLQLVDDFLGTGFTRVFNRSIGGTLILDRTSKRDFTIPDHYTQREQQPLQGLRRGDTL